METLKKREVANQVSKGRLERREQIEPTGTKDTQAQGIFAYGPIGLDNRGLSGLEDGESPLLDPVSGCNNNAV